MRIEEERIQVQLLINFCPVLMSCFGEAKLQNAVFPFIPMRGTWPYIMMTVTQKCFSLLIAARSIRIYRKIWSSNKSSIRNRKSVWRTCDKSVFQSSACYPHEGIVLPGRHSWKAKCCFLFVVERWSHNQR